MPEHRSTVETHYHPLLFLLMTLTAATELGLAAYLVCVGNESGVWPGSKALLIFFVFSSSWTVLFSTAYMLWVIDRYSAHFLASIASSVIWLLLTGILWGLAAGLLTRARSEDNCLGTPIISRCRQFLLTVEALGWVEFGICGLTLFLTCLFVWSTSSRKRISKYLSI